jgi:hypothetical protein
MKTIPSNAREVVLQGGDIMSGFTTANLEPSRLGMLKSLLQSESNYYARELCDRLKPADRRLFVKLMRAIAEEGKASNVAHHLLQEAGKQIDREFGSFLTRYPEFRA